MGKVFLATLPSEYGTRVLLADGQMLKFHLNGKCVGEFPVDFNVVSPQEVDVVSVLVAGSTIEVGYNIGQEFSKKTSLMGLADIAKRLNNTDGLIFVGIRDGSVENTSYTQYIYAYLKGSVNNSIIS